MNGNRIVIVGAGLAALRAGERLRELGFAGTITVIGNEPHHPYHRPPLSKHLLAGKLQPDQLGFSTFTDPDITWKLGTAATRLDPHQQTVHLANGTTIDYDGLIIATGVEPRNLPDVPHEHHRIWPLRTIADASEIDTAMSTARHVAVVGGGFIGCEVASTARERAIDISTTLFTRALGHTLGEIVGDIHTQHGARLHLGVGVATWETGPEHVTVKLADGHTITADLVVVGVGTIPCVDWLDGNDFDLTDGILCDATCHVIGADNIVAAGDCARWPNLRFDQTPRRVEHWINAVEQARAAAENLLTGRHTATPFAPLPRFWSEQHGHRIQSVGMPSLGDTMTITHGNLQQHRFVATYTRNNTIVGAIALDSPRQLLNQAVRVGLQLQLETAA